MPTLSETRDIPGILFHALHRAYINAVQAQLHDRGLSDLGSPLILFILHRRGDRGEISSQRELAQALGVSQATIATSLKSLERLGYVERRLDDRDNRRNRIAITEKGAAAVRQCVAVCEEVDRRMTCGLSQQELTQLEGLHRKMLDNLSQRKEPEKGGRRPCCEA